MSYKFGDNLGFARTKSPDVFKEYIYAEKNVHTHPYVTLSRLRVIFEWYSDRVIQALKIPCRVSAPFHERLRLLRGKIPDVYWRDLEDIRPTCNAASHELLTSKIECSDKLTAIALRGLRLARDYAIWYYEKIEKHQDLDTTGEFILPPASSFEEELRYAHEGDGYAALRVSMWHSEKALEDPFSENHRILEQAFLDLACELNITDAKHRKAIGLIYSANSIDDKKAGIAIIDELITEGLVFGVYCDKACAFASINRELTGVSVARKGVEAGDPYAMNLLAQWAGMPGKGFSMTDEERAKLYERSLEIAFNCEAAYYLSMFYAKNYRFDDAIGLLEKALHSGEDDRGLLEFELGRLLIKCDKGMQRPLELFRSIADKSAVAALNAAETLVNLGHEFDALIFFRQAVIESTDMEIRDQIESFVAVRDALLSYEGISQADLSFLVSCLGDN